MTPLLLCAILALHDGDSGTCRLDDGRSIKIRLAGLDAIETAPRTRCRAQPDIWACTPSLTRYGPLATTRARQLSQQGADCKPNGGRSYGRVVVRCRLPDGRDLGSILVNEGLAISEPRFGDQYRSEEQEARRRGLGVWAR